MEPAAMAGSMVASLVLGERSCIEVLELRLELFGCHLATQQLLMGASAAQKTANMVRSLEAGLIAPTELIARAV